MTINKIMARWYIVSSCGEWLRLICIPIFLLFQPFSGSRCSTEFNYLSYGSCVRGPYVCMRECVCVCVCVYFYTPRVLRFCWTSTKYAHLKFQSSAALTIFRAHTVISKKKKKNWVQCLMWIRRRKKIEKLEKKKINMRCWRRPMLDGWRFAVYFKHFLVWRKIFTGCKKSKTKSRK